LILSTADRRSFIERGHARISLNRQCELLQISKGSLYYKPVGIDPYNLELMDLIDRQYTETPFYGSRKMRAWLNSQKHRVNRKRVQRLMRLMGIEAIYPKPNLSRRRQDHKVYPYLLHGVDIVRPDHVWSTDITYIRVGQGFVYLTAVIDWHSRYVLSWQLSNALDASFCIEAVSEALDQSEPEIFNTDQGSQYTSGDFLKPLLDRNIRISMDSKGRALDNIFIERLWRTVKYEEVYLKEYQSVRDARSSLKVYFNLN
jgi:putative transposase